MWYYIDMERKSKVQAIRTAFRISKTGFTYCGYFDRYFDMFGSSEVAWMGFLVRSDTASGLKQIYQSGGGSGGIEYR